MGESLGLGKKSSGPETDTETWSWFRLPIPKPGFGHTLECGPLPWLVERCEIFGLIDFGHGFLMWLLL